MKTPHPNAEAAMIFARRLMNSGDPHRGLQVASSWSEDLEWKPFLDSGTPAFLSPHFRFRYVEVNPETEPCSPKSSSPSRSFLPPLVIGADGTPREPTSQIPSDSTTKGSSTDSSLLDQRFSGLEKKIPVDYKLVGVARHRSGQMLVEFDSWGGLVNCPILCITEPRNIDKFFHRSPRSRLARWWYFSAYYTPEQYIAFRKVQNLGSSRTVQIVHELLRIENATKNSK